MYEYSIGSDAFKRLRDQQPTLLDLLLTFPSAKPSVDRLVDTLSALQPRSYSCTNTPLTHPRELHFAFNVADYTDKHQRHRLGVCTPWLDRLASSNLNGNPSSVAAAATTTTAPFLRVYLRPNATDFRVPNSSIHKPLILVGPGTGVAPFIGFLAHRAEQRRLRLAMGSIARVPRQAVDAAFGPIYLFYGCRDDRLDFLYQYEIEQAKTNGTLTELILAISRRAEHTHRRYVQDGLRERATLIWQLMTEKQAMIFVCG
jgi:methionine synthase reductase